jgi:hypothetical protein
VGNLQAQQLTLTIQNIKMKKLLFTFTIFIVFNTLLHAQVVVVPGTFPVMCQGGDWVTQTSDILITETNPGDFNVGSCYLYGVYFQMKFTINLPNNYEFDYTSGVYHFSTNGDIVGSGSTGYPLLRADYYCNTATKLDTIRISGLRVRAKVGANATDYAYRNGENPCVALQTGNNVSDHVVHITLHSVPNPNPTISISGLPALICSNNTTNYPITYSHTGGGTGSLIGTGVSGTNFVPSLASIGSNLIKYSVSNSGCVFEASTTVNVSQAPIVNFTSSDADNIICEGDAVTFTANTGGTGSRFLFLKNGNGIQGPNAIDNYSSNTLSSGDVISVTVDNGAATCPTTTSGITTIVGKIPHSSFSWKSTCGQDQVTFHDLSSVSGSNSINTWSWDYTNDGTIDYTQSTSLPDVSFTYPLTNEYQVRLRVTTDKGCSKDTIIRVYTLPGKTPTPSDPYAINFTLTNQGWAYDGINSTWGWGTAPAAFGQGTRKLWSTGQNSPDGKYKTAEQSYLYGPCINLSQLDKPMIAIKVNSKISGKPSGAILEATNDDGLNWVKLGKINEGLNWYNDFGIVSTPSTLLANSTTNNPSSEGWTDNIDFDNNNPARLSLQPFAGSTSLRFRINFESVTDVGATRYAGIAIDSVWIGNRNKVALLEHFTNNENGGISCFTQETKITCSASNDSVNKIKTLRPLDVAAIHYHTSFPSTDGFNILNPSDPSSRVLYYGVTSSPKTRLDGTNYTSYGSGAGLDVTDADAKTLVFAKFKLDLTVNTSGNTVNAATRITYTGSGTYNTDITLQTVILEETKVENSKTYYNVLRKMLPDAAGNYISQSWINGTSLEMGNSWNSYDGNPNNLIVVAFIQEASSKVVHQAIFQKGAGSTGTVVVTDIDETSFNDESILIYPNPSSSQFNVLMRQPVNNKYSWELHDNLGNIVMTANEESDIFSINANNLSSGLYTLRIINNKGLSTRKKLIVAR